MYGKVFDTLFTGSMRGKGDLQLVFMYMISNATADGICDFTPQCIADATGKPISLIETCITELESRDEMSRTRTDDGRRIRKLDADRPWGWEIINHEMYRKIASREAMKEVERLRKRAYRKKKDEEKSSVVPDVSRTDTGHTGDGVVSASVSEKREIAKRGPKRFVKPTLEQVAAYVAEIDAGIDPQAFIDHYESNGWKVGRNAMKDWKAAVRTWKRNGYGSGSASGSKPKRAQKPDPKAQRDQAVQTCVDELWRHRDDDAAFKDAMSSGSDKWRDFGKNQHGETVVQEALDIIKLRRSRSKART